LLLDPLATRLLAGEFKAGDHIKVSADGDKMEFTAGH
jgi:ATP-dependent Clp protease ATP-binding subunit ClpA